MRSRPLCRSSVTVSAVIAWLRSKKWVAEQLHRDLKQTLKVRPIFLHNHDRIEALIAVIGMALLIFGLIEAELRAALGPDTPCPASCPKAAPPGPPPAPS